MYVVASIYSTYNTVLGITFHINHDTKQQGPSSPLELVHNKGFFRPANVPLFVWPCSSILPCQPAESKPKATYISQQRLFPCFFDTDMHCFHTFFICIQGFIKFWVWMLSSLLPKAFYVAAARAVKRNFNFFLHLLRRAAFLKFRESDHHDVVVVVDGGSL